MNEFVAKIARPVVERAIGQLPGIEKKVLRFRLGLRGKPKNLKDVADRLNVSRTVVRRIEANALRTLRKKMCEIRLQMVG